MKYNGRRQMEHALTVLYPSPTHQRLAFGYEVMMDARNKNNNNNHNISSYMIAISFTTTTLDWRRAYLLLQVGPFNNAF
jgi:hypothetical protein